MTIQSSSTAIRRPQARPSLWSSLTLTIQQSTIQPSVGASGLPCMANDGNKHRYPYAIVWTPIHPLTWVAPYVGHCGVCDAAGRIYDFAGPFCVGQENMLFGWPTRVLTLESQRAWGADSWDPKLYETTHRYERQMYDFLFWNCHSLVAGALNAAGEPKDRIARCLRGWTVVGVAWTFFVRSSHVGGVSGWLQTWGGHAALWALARADGEGWRPPLACLGKSERPHDAHARDRVQLNARLPVQHDGRNLYLVTCRL